MSHPVAAEGICFRHVACDDRLGYFFYLPAQRTSSNGILVCVHGISRNAKEQAERYRPLADQLGMALIAPLFDKARFHGYQRLSNRHPGLRADLMLHKAINEVARQLTIPYPELHLVGYSGGAQFAHRFALLHPQRVASLNLCSAGWYTFPDPRQRFPMGVGRTHAWPPIAPDLKGLLMIPTQILIGSKDTQRDKSLNRKPAIDHQQGRNRLERAHNWRQALLKAQQRLQVKTPLRLTLLEGEEHNFSSNMQNADLGGKVIDFILQQTTS